MPYSVAIKDLSLVAQVWGKAGPGQSIPEIRGLPQANNHISPHILAMSLTQGL
jgi:hypothetical protein